MQGCAVYCGFMALSEAWETLGHSHTEPEVYSQCRIRGVGLELGPETETLVAAEAGGGFLPDPTLKDSGPAALGMQGWHQGTQLPVYLSTGIFQLMGQHR